MKKDKVQGNYHLDAAIDIPESEGDILDKYQPSDGFSEVLNEFDMQFEDENHMMAANNGAAPMMPQRVVE